MNAGWPNRRAISGLKRGCAAIAGSRPFICLLKLLGCVPSLFERTRGATAPEPTYLPRWLLIALTVAVLAAATAVRIWKIWEWPPEGIGFEEFQIAARGNMGPNWARNFITAYTYQVNTR